MGRFIHIILLIAFLVNTFGPLPKAMAEPALDTPGSLRLPRPGVMVHLSPEFHPAILKGVKIHPDDPLKFDFILDQGDSAGDIKQESSELIKYFLAGLTIPENDLWVNLSPYEKDRIIPPSFGLTEMGRDLLAEDYMLKQVTASLIYPEDEIGKKFWRRIYAEAERKFGTTNIPVNTFNKVWIVPEKAVVYENAKAGTAYVVESKLKVMLEEDYLSLQKHGNASNAGSEHSLASSIVREIVIPQLTKEVNEGKNFAQLRQVYNSLILAAWYKKKIKDSILSQVYEDKKKISGVDYGRNDTELIYHRYLQAFKKGVYNYIKEDIDPLTRQPIPRKYFSGGLDLAMNATHLGSASLKIISTVSRAQLDENKLIDVSSEFTATRQENESVSNARPFAEPALRDKIKKVVYVQIGSAQIEMGTRVIQAQTVLQAVRTTFDHLKDFWVYSKKPEIFAGEKGVEVDQDFRQGALPNVLDSIKNKGKTDPDLVIIDGTSERYVEPSVRYLRGESRFKKTLFYFVFDNGRGSYLYDPGNKLTEEFLPWKPGGHPAIQTARKSVLEGNGFTLSTAEKVFDPQGLRNGGRTVVENVLGHPISKPLIVISPHGQYFGTMDATQLWANLIEEMGKRQDIDFVVTSGIEGKELDRQRLEAIKGLLREKGISLDNHVLPFLDIQGLKSVLSVTSSLVSIQSGPAHLAQAMGVPVVVWAIDRWGDGFLPEDSDSWKTVVMMGPHVVSKTLQYLADKIPDDRAMNSVLEEQKTGAVRNVFNLRQLFGRGYAEYRTSKGDFIVILRKDVDPSFGTTYMLNVLDKNAPREMSIAQLHFRLGKTRGVNVAKLNFSNRVGFDLNNPLQEILESQGFHPSNWDEYWASQNQLGFWINPKYRNKGQQGLWNLDRMLMRTALILAGRRGMQYFLISDSTLRGYYEKFGAELNNRFLPDTYDMRINLEDLPADPHVRVKNNASGDPVSLLVQDGPDKGGNGNHAMTATVEKRVNYFRHTWQNHFGQEDRPGQAMTGHETQNGGIDLTAGQTPLQVQNSGEGIKFYFDPALLAQLQNAPGLTPAIIKVRPLGDLTSFLGIVNQN